MFDWLRQLMGRQAPRADQQDFQQAVREGEIAHADPLHLFPGGFTQFNPSDLVSRKGLRIYDDMRMDDQVKAALNLKKYAVLAPDWEIDPKNTDEEVANFVKENLENLDERFEENLWEILSAYDFGYSVTEKIFNKRNDRVFLEALKGRAPHSFEFDIDVFGNIEWLRQNFRLGVEDDRMPPDKFVIYSFQKEFGNAWGRSDLESAYVAWWQKTNTLKWMAMYLERFGIPPIFAFYNPDHFTEKQVEDLKSVLKNMQASTSGIIPRADAEDLEPWTPNSEFASTQTQRTFIPALDRQDQMIARALLMPGLIGLTPEGRNGSFARSQTHFGTFMIIIEHLQSELANIINKQIVKPLVDLNFNVSTYPQFKWMPLTDDMRLEIASTWSDLVKTGAVTPNDRDKSHSRSLLGFPEDENSDGGDNENPEDEANPLTESQKTEVFQVVEEQVGEIEQRLISTLSSKSREEIERIANKIKKQGLTAETVNNLQSKLSVKRDIKRALAEAFERGQNQQSKTQEDSQFLELLAVSLAALLSFKLLDAAKESLSGSVDRNESVETAIEDLRNKVEPFTGRDDVTRDGEEIRPVQIENMVKTEIDKAFNRGVVKEGQQRGGVVGFRYVAEQGGDAEVCRFLDGKIIPAGSPFLASLRPPLHHRCRSALVPVTEADESEFITEAQAGRAMQLAEEGFV